MQFIKIPKKPRQIKQQKYASLTLDDLTKTILINNSNPQKYNISFFTQYLGLDNEMETMKLFNSFSYLRVLQQEETEKDKLKFQIIKFKE